MRNRYFDGIDPTMRAQQRGASSLRIDRGSTTRPSYQVRAETAASQAASYAIRPAPVAPTDTKAANKALAAKIAARAVGVPIPLSL